MYTLSLSSLTELVAWVTSFVNYIDKTYKQYVSGKFVTKKSWHVTTELARALIQDIEFSRRGAMDAFEAGDVSRSMELLFEQT